MKNKDFDPEVMLTPGQAAAILGVETKTVTRWAAAGRIAASRTVGGHRRYKEVDVYALRDGVKVEDSE